MLVITGTGRSGTTALALWLKELDLLPYEGEYIEQFHSGLEPRDVRRVNSAIWLGNDAPMQSLPAQEFAIREFEYPIVKDPMFFYGNVLDTWLSVRRDMKFLISIRKFSNVEKSRINVKQMNQVRSPKQLEADFGRFLSLIVFNKLPYEIICFPDFLDSYEEVHQKITALDPTLKIDFKKGEAAWKKVIKKSKVHF